MSKISRTTRVAMLVLVSAAFAVPAVAQKLGYPPARTVDVVEDLHGERVADPYRWMEDLDSPELKEWIDAQNKLTFGLLAEIPARAAIRQRLTKLWDFERYGIPSRDGGRYFFTRNDGLQNQAPLYVVESLDAQPRLLIDPNKLSADGTVALGRTAATEDGKLLAYSTSSAGSDWDEFRIMDVESGQPLPETLKWIKFSGMAWKKDGSGFFYSRFDEPTGNALAALNKWPKLHLHAPRTPQEKDELVYARPDEPDWSFGATVSEDGRYLVLRVGQGSERKNRLFYRDLSAPPAPSSDLDGRVAKVESEAHALWSEVYADPKNQKERAAERKPQIEALRKQRAELVAQGGGRAHGFVELLTDFDAAYDFLGNDGPVFYFRTDHQAPRGRIIAIDTTKPQRENWKELVPQDRDTLRGVNIVNDQFVAVYLKDAYTDVRVFDLSGKLVRKVDLPGIGSANGFGGRRTDTETFYGFTSYTTPGTIYRYDMKTGVSSVWKQPKVAFDAGGFEIKQVFYPSKDGTKVPMFIVHKKGLKLDGGNPTYLYAYGGFNNPTTPAFSVSNLVWMEMGGVYAVACIRGGGEYGKEWHDGGRLKNKQNVFDDFIAAGEWLIAGKYTRPEKLAIGGGSNGGLLVGAVLNQRPELFGAALPAVGVMDMLRFHKFTIGWGWTSDYGSPDDPEMFKVLRAYSPLHNIRAGAKYPAVMVTTADHDDRVVPAHSFKYTAALQAAQAGDAPILIRVETKAGHGAGKPTSKLIEEAADRWAFLVRSLQMDVRDFASGVQ